MTDHIGGIARPGVTIRLSYLLAQASAASDVATATHDALLPILHEPRSTDAAVVLAREVRWEAQMAAVKRANEMSREATERLNGAVSAIPHGKLILKLLKAEALEITDESEAPNA